MCQCLDRAGAYVGFLRSLFTPRLRPDSGIHKSVAADGSRRTCFPPSILFSLLRYLRLLLLVHGFGIEQEETEITEK